MVQCKHVINASQKLGNTAKSPMVIRANPAACVEIKSYYVIMRETLAHKIIYDQFTIMATVGEIINANTSNAPQQAKK